MPRKVKDRSLDSREARGRLKVRGMPYYKALDKKLHLGYRRLKGRPGTWWARHYLGDQQYDLESIGVADDMSAADGIEILDFWQAQAKARERMAQRTKTNAGEDGKTLTVAVSLDRYEQNLKVRERSIENVQRVRAHLTEGLAEAAVALLTSRRLQTWRDGLLEKMEPASVDRVCNAFRAALNLAADLSEGALSRAPWETGLKSISGGSEPRNVVISDSQVRRVVAEAPKESTEFGLFVELAAVTGARPSQLARILVRQLSSDQVDIPSSRKGKLKNKKSSNAVPIPTSLAARLRTIARDKSQNAVLLTKPSGEPWKKSDHSRLFCRTVERAELDPDVVTIYALRHSSITRQLRANIPIRIVAAVHDTSVAMIEKTYSADIAKFSNDLVRPALIDVGPQFDQEASNVVNL